MISLGDINSDELHLNGQNVYIAADDFQSNFTQIEVEDYYTMTPSVRLES